MVMRTLGLKVALVLAMTAAAAAYADSSPPPPPPDAADADTEGDAAAFTAKYKQAQVDLFDALRNDSSPRQQVLAGRIYIDSDDDISTALRPKPVDVAARAAKLAPDDAFVQWAAADQGSYTSSQCGPTRWPEAEVANLVRLEPDNAAALQFAAALAHAKGDQAALDDVLARIASAKRADDHLGDEVVAWTRNYMAHPGTSGMSSTGEFADETPQTKALTEALQQISYRSSPAQSALENACKPDGDSERAWRRIGWCADAGVLFATKGNSFALRAQGLKLLAAAGATRDDLVDLQRQYDWLRTHEANPMQYAGEFADTPADLVADWHGAADEIAATEHRLKRIGQPLTPPQGWLESDHDDGNDDTGAKAMRESYQEYLKALLDDMRGSSDVRARATALASSRTVEMLGGGAADDAAKPDGQAALAELAAANPTNVLVQWIASTASANASISPTPATTADTNAPVASPSIAIVQRVESDNAFAWALSLSPAGKANASVLQHMAASKRYDEHSAELSALWLAATQKRPPPPELSDRLRAMSPIEGLSADAASKSLAITMSYGMSIGAPTLAIHTVCSGKADDEAAARKESCTAIGRLMLHSGKTLIAVTIGEFVLRQNDALDARDAERARLVAWWSKDLQTNMYANADAFDAYFNDYLASGNEIEAIRLLATRNGKAQPPANWKSPSDKAAEKGAAKAAANGGAKAKKS
jgi:hypothetical protein